MAISKLSTSASLRQIMDKFEEISLQDFSKGSDIEIRKELPSEVKEDKIVIINNENLGVYFISNEDDVPSNAIGIKYSVDINDNGVYLDLKTSTIKLYLKRAFKNINNVNSSLDAYIGKNGKWQQFSFKVFYLYSYPNMADGITSLSSWIRKSGSSDSVSNTMTASSSYLHFESANTSGASSAYAEIYFSQAIDVTNFDTLRVVISAVAYNATTIYPAGMCGLTKSTTDVDSFAVKAQTWSTNKTEFLLDVSNLSGKYYFSVYLKTNGIGEVGARSKIRIYTAEFI